MMDEYIKSALNHFKIYTQELADFLHVVVLLILMAVLGWVIYFIARKWLARLIIKLAGKTSTNWDDLMFDQQFFNRLGLFITPVIITIIYKQQADWQGIKIIPQILNIWIVIAAVLVVSAILNGINRIYESYPIAKNRPIKVFIQVIKIFLYCAAIITVIGILIGENPLALLAGLGAFTAVLMLVFKDAILGFVAGIQLMSNHMVNIGDWIVMQEGWTGCFDSPVSCGINGIGAWGRDTPMGSEPLKGLLQTVGIPIPLRGQ